MDYFGTAELFRTKAENVQEFVYIRRFFQIFSYPEISTPISLEDDVVGVLEVKVILTSPCKIILDRD